jgi:transposase
MAHREVTMLEVKEVLRLWRGGVPKKRIAAQLGFHVKTVRRYIAAAERRGLDRHGDAVRLDDSLVAALMEELRPLVGRPHGEGWERCCQQRDFIERHLGRRVRLSKIVKLLRRDGVQVSYPTLRRFAMSELGFGCGAVTIPVADCAPGEELQCDTGWMTHLQPDLFGRRRRFRAWIFTAVLSRHRFVHPVFRETTHTAIEACEAAWEFFGGIFRVLIVDNTKAIVSLADPLQPRINATFLEYAQARGFLIDTTRVRSPRDKARVERAVPTVRDDCFAGENLHDIDHARRHATSWCLQEYGRRRHSRTQRMPLEHFDSVERPALLVAPTEAYDVPLWCDPKVARDQHAQVARALYSLPTHLVGKTLRARADRTTVRFYSGATLVKVHPRMAPGRRSTDPSDFPPEKAAYALRDVDFLARQAASHGDAVGRFARRLLEGELPWTRMRQVYALLGLARRFGDERLNAACEVALEADMLDVRRVGRMIEQALPTPAPSTAQVVPLARYLRPATQYRLALPPRTDEGDNS